MENDKLTVLIVEDQEINRKILAQILSEEYSVIEAANGQEALNLLEQNRYVSAILLDIVMPIMDGYTFLGKIKGTIYSSIPIIAVTGEKDEKSEQMALNLGAWDYVSKPYQPNILLLCLKNVVTRSQFYLLNEMKHVYEYDSLTGIFNRNKFFEQTQILLDKNPNDIFCLIQIDIDAFHLLNSFWGEDEGDRFLKYMANCIEKKCNKFAPSTCARIAADNFCVCTKYRSESIENEANELSNELAKFNVDYIITACYGIYVITDHHEKIQSMLEKAGMAAKEVKGKYQKHLAFYRPDMSEKAAKEQDIINEMQSAIDNQEFEIYLQPKYNLKTEKPFGAEALIRWNHPTKGLISPGDFIPIFERNGFIGKIDEYMWDKTAALIEKWIKEGKKPAPISVNVSRVNMYNPNIVAIIKGIVAKHDINPSLLNLEITESAYMENPDVMYKTVKELQDAGFIIMMDDFGSGYSSLNVLKDLAINVLKIDMKFLSGNADETRKNLIMASIVHMAGWLDIPVIMEGVETATQVEYLKSIGCGYVQGFYYARPMPISKYEELVNGVIQIPADTNSDNHDEMVKTIWGSGSLIDLIFNSVKEPLAVYEYENGFFRVIRVNSTFNNFYGYGEDSGDFKNIRPKHFPVESYKTLLSAFQHVADEERETTCEYVDIVRGEERNVSLNLQYWGRNENTKVIFGSFKILDYEDKKSNIQ